MPEPSPREGLVSIVQRESLQRYHYLGCAPLIGAQFRYFVRNENRMLALLGFSAAAWETVP